MSGKNKGQAGVGLIEVLIALLVLSIGMLGLAGLQVWSLKNNQGSMERAVAVMQMLAIADVMRADRTLSLGNGFDVEADASTEAIEAGDAFATDALRRWRNNLLAHLGQAATGGVDCNGPTCTIVVRWNDRSEIGRTQELTTEVRL